MSVNIKRSLIIVDKRSLIVCSVCEAGTMLRVLVSNSHIPEMRMTVSCRLGSSSPWGPTVPGSFRRNEDRCEHV